MIVQKNSLLVVKIVRSYLYDGKTTSKGEKTSILS